MSKNRQEEEQLKEQPEGQGGEKAPEAEKKGSQGEA